MGSRRSTKCQSIPLRKVAVGRTYLLAEADPCGERAAAIYLVVDPRFNGIDSKVYLRLTSGLVLGFERDDQVYADRTVTSENPCIAPEATFAARGVKFSAEDVDKQN